MLAIFKTFFCLLILSLSSCKSKENNTQINNIAAPLQAKQTKTPKKIYFALGELESGMQTLIKSNPNLQEVKFLDERIIDKQTWAINKNVFQENLTKAFPNPNQTGVCYLNVESPYLEMLRDKDYNDPEFKKSLALYLDIIKNCKQLRPNVKFGFYAIPFTTYWQTSTGFFKKNEKIAPLLKEVDFLFPSLYMFYDDGIVGTIKNTEYLESNLKNGIELSLKYKKPLFPFVWHRYHPSNERISLNNMSEEEWEQYLTTIAAYQYKNKKIDGIMWWGADSWEYANGYRPKKLEFNGSAKEFQKVNDKNLVKKTKQLLKILSEN